MSFLRSLSSSSRSFPPSHTSRMFSTTRMCALAKISLIGRLAAPPELIATSTGRDVVKYAVGTSHGPRDDPKTSWFRVNYYAPEGQTKIKDLLLTLGKGSLVYVDAAVTISKYENKEGQTVSAFNMSQNRLDVLQRRGGDTTEGEEDHTQDPE